MRYLVTGATGFIGGHLVERLVRGGHEVTALVRSPGKAARLRELGVHELEGDMSVFAEVDRELPEVDVVVHLAGLTKARDAATYEAVNYGAVVDLLGCLGRQDWTPRRLLFASSLAAAGPSPGARPLTEADPPAPVEAYGEAKARAEQHLRQAPFPVTCFRPPIVLGPGDPAALTLFKLARRGLAVKVRGVPQRLSWVYVDDLVAAILAMAGDLRPGHRVYFTCSDQVIDTDELWQGMQVVFNHELIELPVPGRVLQAVAAALEVGGKAVGRTVQLDRKKAAQMTKPAFVASSAALREELGWRARVPFVEALQRTKLGYEALGWL